MGMPFVSLVVALSAVNPSQGRRDTALQVPASSLVQPFAPPDSVRQRLIEMEEYHADVRDAAKRAAVAGASLIMVAAMAWAADVVVHDLAADPEDTTERPHPVLTLAAWTGGIGAACEVFAGAAAIYSTVLSHRIEEYERRTGCRLSVQPVVAPRERALGAVARVKF